MTARRLWVRFETYHDVTYFTPESLAANARLGCKGGWMGYFGTRAAPLGAVPPEVVAAAFYSFHPRKVRRALPDAWGVAPPEAFLATRLAGVDGALRRMLGADVATLGEAAELAAEAAGHAATAGRVLGAANAALPLPDEPHLKLWQACTTLRESRGDGHVAALVALDLGPCEALVLFGADHGLAPDYLRAARGWTEDEWREAEEALAARGQHDGGLTAAGRALREEVERLTDAAAERPWRVLGERATTRFSDLLTPVALRLAERNDAMRSNPMALDPVRELTG